MKRKIYRIPLYVTPLTIAVTGGSDVKQYHLVAQRLDDIWSCFGIKELWHGAAQGVDEHASRWARENNIKQVPFPADWDKYGKAAGPVRNREMLSNVPSILIAFPGNSGTRDCVMQAHKNGIPVCPIEFGRFVRKAHIVDPIRRLRGKVSL